MPSRFEAGLLVGLALAGYLAGAFQASAAQDTLLSEQTGQMVTKEGRVYYRPADQPEKPAAVPQALDFGDSLRTLPLGRATVRFTDWSELRMKELTVLQIQRTTATTNKTALKLDQGQVYMISRGGTQSIPFEAGPARGVARGTEYLLAVDAQAGRTEVTMLDGEVELSNGVESRRVTSGFQAVAVAGRPIEVRPILRAQNVVQWWIYYPGLLDPAELNLNAAEQGALGDSLEAYRQGDLQRALERYPGYPTPAEPASEAQRVYYAGLLLAVGAADRAEAELRALQTSPPGATALKTMIVALTLSPGARDQAILPVPSTNPLTTASEWLAWSYVLQGQHDLAGALAAARRAVEQSPRFGFGWARVAELEFSFGRTRLAREAVNQALAVSPRNAQAKALEGFLLAADNHIPAALRAFEAAIELDPALANAWLGHGLCQIRRGRAAAGRNDLQTAAILEPSRALLRSYAGKAFSDAHNARLAQKEFTYAEELDPQDPTPWLYSALEKWQANSLNSAVDDLERSIALNDNRALFRSRLLLDEDRAVRSANLAGIYRDADMVKVSVREAARGVTYDYANDSAHLFLANSYNELRDPTRFNLRYENIWFNELLLANVLSPVGGGQLSQHVSQQEYGRFFQADGLGLASSTLFRSDNKSLTQLASQWGTYDSTSYALDLDYQHNEGVRPNNELSDIEWFTTLKQQVTEQDTALVLVKYEDFHSGDNFQYYDPKQARPFFHFDEDQQPLLAGAWHHEWSPGMHTLLLGGRLVTEQSISDRAAPQLLLVKNGQGFFRFAGTNAFDVNYNGDFEIYLAELNQICQWERVTLSFGTRFQPGTFDTRARFTNPSLDDPSEGGVFQVPVAQGSLHEDFERVTGYGYLTVEPVDRLWLTCGFAYDDLTYPRNFRNPPLSPGTAHASQLGPKAGVVWSPVPLFTLRGAFTHSLGGVSEDENFRLEQTQVAGFPQSFRSLISESLVGSVSAPEYETASAALDFKFPTRTYAGFQIQRLTTEVDRTIGYLAWNNEAPYVPASTGEFLSYREDSIEADFHQLAGEYLTLGLSYSFNWAELEDALPAVPVAVLPSARSFNQAQLQQTTSYVAFNHPSGLFARADATWYNQRNFGYTPALPGDDFIQENLYVGYRFFRRRAELLLGILNLSGQDYHLNPLNPYLELPRERSFIARLKIVF